MGNEFAAFAAELSAARAEGYRALLERRGPDPARMASLLESHLRWPERSGWAAGRSHVHNNGFLKLSLWRDPATQATIRLHVWRPGEDAGTPSVHDHRWSFASVVLAGRLSFSNFDLVEDSRGGWISHRVTDADAEGTKQQRRGERCELRRTCDYDLTAGGTHWVSHEQLHRTPPPSTFAATLVLTGPPQRRFSRVVTPLGSPAPGAGDTVASARTLDPQEVERAIRDVIGGIPCP